MTPQGENRSDLARRVHFSSRLAALIAALSRRVATSCRIRCRTLTSLLPTKGGRGILFLVTVAFLESRDSAVNHIALDKEDEAVKRFVLSLPVDANGSVLELDGRAVACVVPVVEEPVEANGVWSEAKNARRCALIDSEIDGKVSAGEAVELHLLQREMLAHRHKVAPLPLAEARELHQELLAKARRRPSE